METRSAERSPHLGAVAHQTAAIGELGIGIYCRNLVTRHQPQYFVAIAWFEEESVATDNERLGLALCNGRERSLEIKAADFARNNLALKRSGCREHVIP